MDVRRFVPVTPLEVASGWIPGVGASLPDPAGPLPAPVAVLEEALRAALTHPPCVVAFSGGRDSSVLLALALRVARREGLPLPVPVTRRHPHLPDTNEDEWQEQVVRHLGVRDWVRLHFTDEMDVVGPSARRSLIRHGVVWPATVHTRALLLAAARGGSFVTGDGGDEHLGPQRLAAVAQIRAHPTRIRREVVTAAAAALVSPRVRPETARRARTAAAQRPWLRPAARRQFVRAVAADLRAEPLTASEGIRRLARRRASLIGLTNLRVVAAREGVDERHPFHEPRFVAALAQEAGVLGLPGRTSWLRHLFEGLLPDAVLARRSKATFNAAAFAAHSRAFVAGWDGSGLDETLVDPAVLADVWRLGAPHPGSLLLLQTAWLAAAREDETPATRPGSGPDPVGSAEGE